MKKLLISSMLFVSLVSTINFILFQQDNFIQFLDISSVMIGLELVFLNLCSAISDNLIFFCRSRRILICSFFISRLGFSLMLETWRTKFMCGSHRSYMTDRQRLSWQQTFFKRVISLSSVRWFFSLLNEQW